MIVTETLCKNIPHILEWHNIAVTLPVSILTLVTMQWKFSVRVDTRVCLFVVGNLQKYCMHEHYLLLFKLLYWCIKIVSDIEVGAFVCHPIGHHYMVTMPRIPKANINFTFPTMFITTHNVFNNISIPFNIVRLW